MGNVTEDEPLSPYLVAVRTCFVAVVVIMIITGNALSIAVTRSMPGLADSTKILMISLAAYDLLTGVMSIPNVIASAFDRWPFGEFYCSINGTIDATCCCMSITLIVLMNAERYIAVTLPFRFPILCAKRRVIAVVLIASVVSLVLQICLSYFKEDNNQFKAVLICDVVFNGTVLEISVLFFLVILPLVVLTYIYLRLIKLSQNHAVMLNKCNNAANDTSFLDNKALRAFLVVTILFAVCWTPLRVVRVVAAITDKMQPIWLSFTAKGFAVSNSFFNVFIYCFFNRSFRQAAKRLMMRYFPCFKSSTVAPMTTPILKDDTPQPAVRRKGRAAFISVEL
ncbi:beta-1 adrenergic receptor-like [Patiria miniata]|uniref:G-protein coupled receptors family 1 profile domain-containing protein n=1 Tax=Patiria miniata TaxID=46514 RepID=A0A914A1J4_PATMI|nr:beta-1 adrenergic receptor-like [Patiria miniata]